MELRELQNTARAMVAPGKGILAVDESASTCAKRFQAAGVDETESNRVAYRSLLLGATRLGDYISGAILYDETIRQATTYGVPFPTLLADQGIMIGIKVDTGAKPLALHSGENVTEGLDGLRERLVAYKALGARFCKWRAVIAIAQGLPSRACLHANAHSLARYAALCQETDLVPIVEPEVLLDGDHCIETCFDVTVETQHAVFEQLYKQGVQSSAMVLKPNMVLAGKHCRQRPSVEQVAEHTLRCLQRTVPVAVPGMAFLSGGQSDEDATRHLNAINVLAQRERAPWRLTFSYARALQHAALTIWKGQSSNVADAQKALLFRARLNTLAAKGEYDVTMETES